MASTKSLNAKNLESLGAARLAELLIEVSTGNAVARRRLRFELAGSEGGAEVAREVRKRLATIAKARSFIDWHKVRALATDLEAQHRAIVDHVAQADPAEALDLLWRLIALADPVFARCDDSNGRVMAAFAAATPDLAPLAKAAKVAPRILAQRIFDALGSNGWGQYDDLIPLLADSLGAEGLDHLKVLFVALDKEPVAAPRQEDREVIGWGSSGPLYADEIERRRRDRTLRHALQQIADAQGDVDAFIAQQDERALQSPAIAAGVARRLLQAGRTAEALAALDAVGTARAGWIVSEWELARIDALQALGRGDEAQAFRWDCFARSLNRDHLRAFLKALPDFEDFDAEQRAMAHARAFPDVDRALAFLLEWPALDRANRLILDRAAELDGNHYEALSLAAEALAPHHPLAATIVLRAMIDFALINARAKRYPHAARHLAECAGLASRIEDYGPIPTHEAYHRDLLQKHGRKTAFWSA